MDALHQICFKNKVNFHSSNKMFSESIYKTIEKLAPRIEDFIIEAKAEFSSDQKELFKPIFTREGLCYTFNSLSSREIFTDAYESI